MLFLWCNAAAVGGSSCDVDVRSKPVVQNTWKSIQPSSNVKLYVDWVKESNQERTAELENAAHAHSTIIPIAIISRIKLFKSHIP